MANLPFHGAVKRLRNHQLDLRDMLLTAGVGQFNAVMSIPYMNFLPMTCDPYAQGVMQIVAGLQRLLNKRGAKLKVDSGLGEATLRALMHYSGPRWQDRSWAQLYGDVIAGQKWQGWIRQDHGATNLSGDLWDYSKPQLGGAVEDLVTNPLVLVAGAAFVWWKWFRKPKTISVKAYREKHGLTRRKTQMRAGRYL